MKMITIMPDFGMAPYAWIKNADDKTTRVGACLADAISGFQGSEYKVSMALETDFAAWARHFESVAGYSRQAMNWDAFHRQGMALAHRLKAELGDQVRVVYDIPVEDPSYATYRGIDVRTEILSGGKTRLIAFHPAPPESDSDAGKRRA